MWRSGLSRASLIWPAHCMDVNCPLRRSVTQEGRRVGLIGSPQANVLLELKVKVCTKLAWEADFELQVSDRGTGGLEEKVELVWSNKGDLKLPALDYRLCPHLVVTATQGGTQPHHYE